ncbi:MAG: AAA family ATPase, partial [Candidatus Electrothrix sp. AR1]|nr:AAA family ATPase [Candidatus Electrothrix sp. AR1]
MINFSTNKAISLPPQGSWPKSVHRFDTRSSNALNAALAAQRPLLVRGNPGTGKSQL